MPTNPASLAVTDAYRQRMLNIRREGERAARAVWGDVDPADLMGTYLVGPLATAVSALQRTGVLLSSGYVKAFIKSEIGKDVLVPTPRGFTGTSFSDVELRAALLRPVVLVERLKAEGVPQGVAMMRGRNVLLRTVALATDSAVRDSLQKLYEKRPEVIGWKRAVAGTCDKCMGAADGSTLPPGAPLDIHPNCECVSEAVVNPIDPRDSPELARRSITKKAGLNELGRPSYGDGRFTLGDNGYITEDYMGKWSSMDANNLLRYGPGKVPKVGRPALSDEEMQKLIGKWDTAMEHAGPLDEAVHVYRGVNWTPEELGVKAGKVLTDPAFGSTSAERSVAQDLKLRGSGLKTVLDMSVSPSVKAIWGANPEESELLLQRGVRYVVKSVEKVGDFWHLKVDALPPA